MSIGRKAIKMSATLQVGIRRWHSRCVSAQCPERGRFSSCVYVKGSFPWVEEGCVPVCERALCPFGESTGSPGGTELNSCVYNRVVSLWLS